ncbi:hypothetical protein KAX35_03770 [candidate division WOR-3 bacterium]|nr:hypothetical protein [candidate division WOR-3 bacterium]
MDIKLWITSIGALATILAAIIAQFLNRRREVKLEELKFKLNCYTDFLSGIAMLGGTHKNYESHLKFAHSINTMNIISSKEVLDCVNELLDYIGTYSGSNYSIQEQDEIIRKLILAIRKDLGQNVGGGLSEFPFRTISPGIRPDEVIET